jgi:hypothetical protein
MAWPRAAQVPVLEKTVSFCLPIFLSLLAYYDLVILDLSWFLVLYCILMTEI